MVFHLANKAETASGVGVATVHKAVQIDTLQAVMFGNVAKCKEMLERTVDTTVAGKSHKVDSFAVLLGIGECRNDFFIVENRFISHRFVDFHQVLIYNASGADVKVSHLGVTHLTVGKTNVFAARLQFRMRILFQEIIPIRSRCRKDDVRFGMVADSPTVQNH